ncbi:hypothetical protein DL96DRAFT_1613699 [Flagelloscypha sp. PMI_526]|nr:hypothetical protein DL96DRAFT_1613699 [Flagelloscypha sp. PMI_526]
MAGPSRLTNAIVSGAFFGVAQLMTILRLIFRAKNRRLWYDDAWALLSFACSAMMMSTTFDRLNAHRSQHHMIISYWISSFSFQNTLWSARMSVICAIIRLTPSQDSLHSRMKLVALLFLGMWIGLLIHKSYVCGSDLSWYSMALPHCTLGLGVMINELVTDILADIALAVVPILLYRNISLPAHQRTMLFIIFASSLLISAVSAVHAYFLMGPAGIYEGFTAEIECSVALMVANIGVVLSFVYRLFRREIDSDPYTFEYSIRTDGRVRIKRKPGSNQKATDVVFAQPNTTTVDDSWATTKTDGTRTEPFELENVLYKPKNKAPDSSSGISVLVHTKVETDAIPDVPPLKRSSG